jgi:hypothetical protein
MTTGPQRRSRTVDKSSENVAKFKFFLEKPVTNKTCVQEDIKGILN